VHGPAGLRCDITPTDAANTPATAKSARTLRGAIDMILRTSRRFYRSRAGRRGALRTPHTLASTTRQVWVKIWNWVFRARASEANLSRHARVPPSTMTVQRRQARECERARALGSQALDGPLSDLDRYLLDTHLDECPACDEAVGAMAELTARLRTAPELIASVAAVPVRPARRPGRAALQVAGIAAVVAAFAGLGALVASPSGASPPQAPPRLVVAERTELRVTLLRAHVNPMWKLNEPASEPSPQRRALRS